MSNTAARLGFETLTLDSDARCEPDLETDILDWNYRSRRYGAPDMIHASIPCTEFSICHTRSERNLPLARKIADRTRQIIDYFLKLNPRCVFTIENPSTSLLNKEDAVAGLSLLLVDKRIGFFVEMYQDTMLACASHSAHAILTVLSPV